MADDDVITQHANVTGSMKLRNTKLCVIGHYFCCIIPAAAFCGRTKREQDFFHRSSFA